MQIQHLPVLASEVVELLAPSEGVVVDCTLGLGGHAERILETAPGVELLGIDRDRHALEIARRRLARFGDRLRTVEGNFFDLAQTLERLGVGRVCGVLADLGVSSLQLETAERGFSFQRTGPLDMRMGGGKLTAGEIVHRYSEGQMEKIFREYGEERQARRIARAIAKAREEAPIATTTDLRDVVHRAKGGRGGRIDPATRVFQALRIEVNQELVGLAEALEAAVESLEGDGRLVVLSYHSLEDRVVKHTLRELARGEIDPVTGATRAETRLVEVLTGKPIRPSEVEVAGNPRSRSARLRAARRLAE